MKYPNGKTIICRLCKKPFTTFVFLRRRYCPECREIPHYSDLASRLAKGLSINCLDCGTPLKKGGKTSRCRPCAFKAVSGPANHNWKGGLYRNQGYIRLSVGNSQTIQQHRFIWEQQYGPIPPGWHVHHINGIRDDNRIENLQAMPAKEHAQKAWLKILQKRIRSLEMELKTSQPQLPFIK